MPINMNTDPLIYWAETKRSVIDIEYHKKMQSTCNMDTSSALTLPHERLFYEKYHKDMNSIYQYCDRTFNFSAAPIRGSTSDDEEDDQHSTKRKITISRDPMSHRIIEKRRRDRMNNCLADLSRLIPAEYMKKGRGRIEKTEIIEMAIKHMKYLQALTGKHVDQCGTNNCIRPGSIINDRQFVNGAKVISDPELSPQEHYKLGYQECVAETMRFLVELQGFIPSDALCVKMISHLQQYYEKLTKGDKLVSSATENISTTDDVEAKTINHTSINEMREKNASNSITGHMSSDDGYQENVSTIGSHNSGSSSITNCNGSDSQLRDMLVGPYLNRISTTRPNVIRLFTPDPPSSTSNNDNSCNSSNRSLYKFKNNIRERFEHSNLEKSSTSLVVGSRKRRAHSLHSMNSHSSLHTIYQNISQPVPIFALHSNGSFYVPLTIDSNLLAPFITDLNNDDNNMHEFTSLLLHPVTISVNFNRPLMQSSSLMTTKVSFSSTIP